MAPSSTPQYPPQSMPSPRMMPEPQIWRFDQLKDAVPTSMPAISTMQPASHQHRHSMSASGPSMSGLASPTSPNSARPLPQPPKKERHYSLPNSNINLMNNMNNNNNHVLDKPPVLLPKPPKSVISSVIGLPRVGGHAPTSNNMNRDGPPKFSNRPAYGSPLVSSGAMTAMPTIPHASGPGSFVLTQAEMAELNHPAPPSVLGNSSALLGNASMNNSIPLHIPGQVSYTGKDNSVQLLNECVNVRDMTGDGIDFSGTDLGAVDKYVRNIQHMSNSITPDVLTMKFLARPFRTDLQRVRAIFIWMAENIVYLKLASDGEGGGEKRRPRAGISATEDPMPSVRPDLETAESTLKDRCCSNDGFALLFHKLASTAGIHSGIVRGYLKNPKDELDSNRLPAPNHSWNVGKDYSFYFN
ncbi:hypothetical protein BDF19DRAFT_314677 [Syncephalis fuscata]|nr:hypothetical protein BDF19DRAFT_314677 [Syncephalis fuscata]